jgi:hypothetical protein
VLADAPIAGANACHAGPVHQDVLAREPAEEIDAFRLDLRREPGHEPVQRNDVVAVVAERRRDDRKGDPGSPREEVHVVHVHVGRKRRPAFLEIGNEIGQCRRVEHGTREHVRPSLARLLEHRHRQRVAAMLFLQLCEPERG